MEDIRNLQELIQPHIEEGSVVVKQKSTRLTVPGENYGSLMKALDINIKDGEGKEHTLHTVAKQIPDNEWLQKLFNVQSTFVKEMNMYDKVVSALVAFQKERGIDEIMNFFPKYYGGRLNIKPGSDVVDEDGVILLENLKFNGFTTGDRFTGYNLQAAKLILKNLAIFHAVPLALKLTKPEDFEKEIAPHIKYVNVFDAASSEELELNLCTRVNKFAKELEDECSDVIEKVEKLFWSSLKTNKEQYDSIFNTISHNDFWINNTMVKIVSGEVVENKMIDFQLTDYNSAGRDVVFFLYSSVQMPVIENHCDELIKLYYDKFIDVLKILKCDVSVFTFEAFQEELSLVSKRSEFLHCVLITRAVYAPVESVKELNEMKKEDLIDDDGSEGEREKAVFIIREFIKRKWI